MAQSSHWEQRLGRLIGRVFSPAGRRGRLVVFCYHQVLADKDPLRPGEPTLDEFRADIERIAGWFNVLPLPRAARALEAGELPPRAACITFDDGYLNNFELAAPALEALGLPATFFVTCGALERGVMWNDLVIDAVAHASARIDTSGLGERAPELADHLAPREAAQRIIDAIKYLPLEERWLIAERFYRDNVGAELPRKMMGAEQVADLARRGFDIGAHTVNHPILSKLADNDARREIDESVRWVSEATGAATMSFAYPNGRPGIDYDPIHATQARDAGCSVAVTTDWALGSTASDRYQIPRIGPWWRQGHSPLAGLLRVYARSLIAR